MKYHFSFVFLFAVTATFGQSEILEGNPSSLRWRQIKTDNFRIIFPDGFDEQAQRMANTLEHIRDAETVTLRAKPKRLSVILQSQSSTSNGFVSYLPRRSEFFAMPPQNNNFLGTNDWLDLLAVHEYRHAVQFQQSLRGFNKLIYYVLGPTTAVGMAQASVPGWFWEGDAVVTETALTPSGRGKIPYFSMLMRTNLMEGRVFNYHKQYLQSYKHQIPDHYVLGYHMVSFLRKKTNDPQIWDKISSRTWSVPFIPFAFSNAIHHYTDRYVTGLYRDMAADFQKDEAQRLSQISLTPFDDLTPKRKKGYTNYQYAQALPDDNVLVVKSGLSYMSQFVIVQNGEEVKSFIPGFRNDAGMVSASDSVVVWTEYGYDPRWPARNYSLIKTYNFVTGDRAVVGGKHSRFGAASISHNSKYIIAVETDTDYRTRLKVFSFPESKIVREFRDSVGVFYSMPSWAGNDRDVVVMKTTDRGRSLIVLDVSTGVETEVLFVGHVNIGAPVMTDKYILFNAPATGVDNIYALRLDDKKIYQVTSSKYGAYNADVSRDGKKIFYSDQGKDGLNLVSIPFDTSSWIPVESLNNNVASYAHLIEQEGGNALADVPSREYPISRFSKLRGIANPYNWGVFIENDLSALNIGVSSQDLLSTTRVEVGYQYNIAESSPGFRAAVSYQGFYPIIDASIEQRDRRATESYSDEQNVTFSWDELNVEAGWRLPFNLTSSRYSTSLAIGNMVGLTHVSAFTNSVDGGGRIVDDNFYRDYVDNGNLLYNHFTFSAGRFMRRAPRDIYSRWGQRISVQYYQTLNFVDNSKNKFDGRNISVIGSLYFPGIGLHHSVWGYGAYQHTHLSAYADNYIFPNQVPVPRGIGVIRLMNFYSASANYSLPIWYPDIAIGPILNIQRLKATLFYDYAIGSTRIPGFQDVEREYASAGIEGRVDVNLFRTPPQFEFGVRFSQGLMPEVRRVELIIGVINF
ncbi:MAG TPA: hypothetical protein VD927_16225 [Chryseosolibacter sp.]|nr:hypothetical protein [Chryseosolibacter sp.]